MTTKEARILFKKITNINVKSIEEIFDGFSNQNFLVNDAYVLRILKDNRDETLSIENELNNYNALNNLKISEKLIYLNIENGIKITKYIHQAHYYSNIKTEEEIIKVAKAIKKLHKSNIKVKHKYEAIEKLNTYKNNIPSALHLNFNYEKEIINSYLKITNDKPLIFSHNDLVKGNILFTNSNTYFIDREYGAMNYEYFDLASFISENNLTEKESNLFLYTYFGKKLTDLIKKRIYIFIKFLDILFYYWACYYYLKRKDLIYRNIANEKKFRISNSNF